MQLYKGQLKSRVKSRDVLITGVIMDSRSSAVVEVYKDVGYDMVLIDREHSAFSEETVADHIRTARCLGLPVMVRVADDSYHELNRILDQAPDGIFIPRIRSREQVENILRTVRYKPDGMRGLAGSSCPIGKYAGWDSISEQITSVNSNTVIGIQIETVDALENLDDILSVPGVDVALVGNDDLSLDMGMPGMTTDPRYIETVEYVIQSCGRHNVLPGIAVRDAQGALYWIEKGMKMIWHAADIFIIYAACAKEISEIRNEMPSMPIQDQKG